MPLGEQCGFCERYIEADEDLVPIYAGEPDTDARSAVGSTITIDEKVIVDVGDEYLEMIGRAVEEASVVGAEVMPIDAIVDRGEPRVRTAGRPTSFKVLGETVDVGDIYRKSVVKLMLKIPTKRVLDWTDVNVTMPEPDLEVCKFCRSSFTRDEEVTDRV